MNETQNKSPAPRMALYLNVEFRKSYSRSSDSGELRNISLTGAFLKTETALQKNDKVTLTFEVSGRVRKINARVIWTSATGAGVMFQHFNNRDIQIIDDLMYFVETNRLGKRDVLDSIFKKVG